MEIISGAEPQIKIKIHVALPRDVIATLDRLAANEQESRSVLIRKAVKLLLEQQGQKTPAHAA